LQIHVESDCLTNGIPTIEPSIKTEATNAVEGMLFPLCFNWMLLDESVEVSYQEVCILLFNESTNQPIKRKRG
jgi:hypothetical protein